MDQNTKGKGLALPSHSNSPLHQQPENASQAGFLPPRQSGTPLPTQHVCQWDTIPFTIKQGSRTTVINADIDCRFPKTCIGEVEAQHRGLKTLPSLVPGVIETTKGDIRCTYVALLTGISSHASQDGQFWPVSGGSIVIHVIPAEYGEASLTIGDVLLNNLLKGQPEFNRFCYTHLDGFASFRMRREPRRTHSKRRERQRGLDGSSSYVSSYRSTTRRSLASDHATLSTGSHQPVLPYAHGSPLSQGHWQSSPMVQSNQIPMGVPDIGLGPSNQAVLFPIPAHDFTNMSFPSVNTSGNLHRKASGPTSWGIQGMPGPAEDISYGGYSLPPSSGPSGSRTNAPF